MLRTFALLSLALLCNQSHAIELFVKGNMSKSFLSTDEYTISASGAGGIAFALLSRMRLEGRYTYATSLRNKLEASVNGTSFTLNDIITETTIYNVSLEFEIFGERSNFQPYIAVGVGYIITDKSYTASLTGSSETQSVSDPRVAWMSAMGGLGFRIRLAKQIALEADATAYGIDLNKPDAQFNWDGRLGLRIFL